TAVDDRGRILNSVKGASASGIPVIEVSNVNDGLRDRAVLAASKILGDLPEQMRHRISKVSARTQDSITTELDDGRYAVLWGDASDLALKQAVVDKIVNDPTKIGDKHQVDVSAPLRPIIK
ncbi:MAG: cell division protein FtsQ/DivIB, partial [Bifidobacterium mongoliense]|nr:cell division protein FtsQ/DivIB [Bifidobacterium mongoliense]